MGNVFSLALAELLQWQDLSGISLHIAAWSAAGQACQGLRHKGQGLCGSDCSSSDMCWLVLSVVV